MSDTVKIHHPLTGGTAVVQRRALGQWAAAGWVEAPPDPPRPKTQAKAKAGASPDGSKEIKPDDSTAA